MKWIQRYRDYNQFTFIFRPALSVQPSVERIYFRSSKEARADVLRLNSGNRSPPFVKSNIEANRVLQGILLMKWKIPNPSSHNGAEIKA